MGLFNYMDLFITEREGCGTVGLWFWSNHASFFLRFPIVCVQGHV